jgi:hypothetical protein
MNHLYATLDNHHISMRLAAAMYEVVRDAHATSACGLQTKQTIDEDHLQRGVVVCDSLFATLGGIDNQLCIKSSYRLKYDPFSFIRIPKFFAFLQSLLTVECLKTFFFFLSIQSMIISHLDSRISCLL